MESVTGVLEREIEQQAQDQVPESIDLTDDGNATIERSFFGRVKNMLSRRSPGQIAEDSSDSDADDEIALTDEQAAAAENLAENAGLLRWTADRIKAVGPQTAGALTGAGLTFLSLVSGPVPPEIAGTLAAAVGGATIGGGMGETRGEKLRNAAIGAAAGLTASQGMGQLTENPTAKAALGMVDDVPTAILGINAAAKAVSNHFGRMHPPESRTPTHTDGLSPALNA